MHTQKHTHTHAHACTHSHTHTHTHTYAHTRTHAHTYAQGTDGDEDVHVCAAVHKGLDARHHKLLACNVQRRATDDHEGEVALRKPRGNLVVPHGRPHAHGHGDNEEDEAEDELGAPETDGLLVAVVALLAVVERHIVPAVFDGAGNSKSNGESECVRVCVYGCMYVCVRICACV